MKYKHDRIENEKGEPSESSSLRFINVPIILLSLFVGFGATYLALRTKNTSMTPGDSRTQSLENNANVIQGEGASEASIETLMTRGKQVYTTTCQACHQAEGQGIPGAFPPLSESEWVNGPAEQVVAIVLHGLQGEITVKGVKFQGVMPGLKDQLKPEDIAAVSTYVRNSFGNKSELVSIDVVKKVSASTSDRSTPWDGEKDLKSHEWK